MAGTKTAHRMRLRYGWSDVRGERGVRALNVASHASVN